MTACGRRAGGSGALYVLDGDHEAECLATPRRAHNHQRNLCVNAHHSEQQVLQEGVCGCNALEELCVLVQVHAHLVERPVEQVCVDVAPRDLACREDVATTDKLCSVLSTEVLAEAEVVTEPDGEDKCVAVAVLLRNGVTVLHCCVVRSVSAEVCVEVDAADDVADAGVDAPLVRLVQVLMGERQRLKEFCVVLRVPADFCSLRRARRAMRLRMK